MQPDGLTYLVHTCNSRLLVADKDGIFICCEANYQNSEDNTKHVLIDLNNYFSKPCIELLENQVYKH